MSLDDDVMKTEKSEKCKDPLLCYDVMNNTEYLYCMYIIVELFHAHAHILVKLSPSMTPNKT